ncbi:hypothetical protein EJB05_37325, partial [Eragrostis curvula]
MVDGNPSLRPPLHGNDPEPPQTCSWVLLDVHAYVADRQNSTSACAVTSDGAHVVRVTFCAAPPPLVSYICVWSPSSNQINKIVPEPIVEGAGSDLLLLEVNVRGRRDADYFVYKANAGRFGPSLQLIRLPEPCLRQHSCIALLSHRDVVPNGEEDDCCCYYYVAVLHYHSGNVPDCVRKLWIFDSKQGQWSSRLVSLHCPLHHLPTKAIALGEEHGLLGFVDPRRGVLVCDVLGRTPPRYLQLPPNLVRDDKKFETAMLSRDIVVAEGRLTVVDLRRATEPDINQEWNWEVSTWSRKVTGDLWEEDWHNDYNVRCPDILVDEDTDNADLLPVHKDSQGTPRPTLGNFYIAHHTLSLSDSHVVYIMAKVGRRDKKALVLSVDMKKPRLQGVAVFDAERMYGVIFSYAYTQSWIPKYFNTTLAGTNQTHAGDEQPILTHRHRQSV